ncbi:MAG: hypothetical protein ACTSQE_00420 [Candidatus Heimdallarchaeaceae archaeon]
MQSLVHFYYGNRKEAFYTGLGTLIRARGHKKENLILISNDSYLWLEKEIERFGLSLLIMSRDPEDKKKICNKILSTEDSVFLIIDVDSLIESKFFEMKGFLELLAEIRKKNEIILTSEVQIPEISALADYVCKFVKN